MNRSQKVSSSKQAAILIAMLATSFASFPSALALEKFPYAVCHLDYAPSRPLAATLKFKVNSPSTQALQWVIYMPSPAETLQQHFAGIKFSVEGSPASFKYATELSPEHRYVLLSQIPADTPLLKTQVAAKAVYHLTVAGRQLNPGAAKTKVDPLSESDRKIYTAASETIDFQSPSFQSWLKKKGLLRQAGERDIDFAWRTFSAIRRQFNYQYVESQDRHASVICQQQSSDCGGLSWLLVSTLRANGIPARSLVGRWQKTNNNPDSAENMFGECHVKSEFFAENVGWIPMEISGAVSSPGVDQLQFFGRFAGDFITLHLDTDLILNSIWFGISKVRNMQSPLFWVTGSGTVSGNSTETTWQTVFQK